MIFRLLERSTLLCTLKLFSSTSIAWFWIIPSKARPNAEPRNNGGPKARSYDQDAKRSGIGTTKVKKKILRTTTDDDGQKWHDLICGFLQIVVFLFLRFFQMFYTKMFPQIVLQYSHTKMVTPNIISKFLHFKKWSP